MRRGGPLDPQGFMRWLAACPHRRDLCVECGAGTGELSAFLTRCFKKVIAIDKAPPAASLTKTTVLCATAEEVPAEDGSVDLLLSMQALHHFDIDRHLREAERVLRRGGVFAALSWGEIVLPEAVAEAYRPVITSVAPYWEPCRDWVVSGYPGLPMPGRAVTIPKARLSKNMTLPALDAEVARWTAVQRALTAGADIAEPALDGLGLSDDAVFEVHWPLVGQVRVL